MDKNEGKNKISLSTILLIIALITIIVMGYYIYKLYNEKSAIETQRSNIQNKIDSLESTNKLGSNFKELMNSLYLQPTFKENGHEYKAGIVSDEVSMTSTDVNNKILGKQSTEVQCIDDEITITIADTGQSKFDTYKITGIDEEVVSIKIIPLEAEATPLEIAFLTREGNVYYLDYNSITNKNFAAKKMTNLTEVIAITKVDTIQYDAMEGYLSLMAIKFDGSHEQIIINNNI